MTSAGDRTTLRQSRAFRAAALRSEVRRAWAVIGVILLIAGVSFRHAWPALPPYVRMTGVVAISLLLAIQFTVLLFVHWARRHDRLLPPWFELTTVIVESL